MERSTKLIIAAIGLGGLGFFLYKKGLFGKKTVSSVANSVVSDVKKATTTVTDVIKVAASPTYEYPYGFKEGDFLQNPNEQTVYLLHNGKKLPVTYAWWMANAKDSWDLVKQVPVSQYMDIPTGATLDA